MASTLAITVHVPTSLPLTGERGICSLLILSLLILPVRSLLAAAVTAVPILLCDVTVVQLESEGLVEPLREGGLVAILNQMVLVEVEV